MQHPDTAMCLAALDLTRRHAPPFLFNHAMRTYAFGHSAGTLQGVEFDEEMLFLGSMLHDLGLVEGFIGEDRFEVDGADAAADFLSRQGCSDKKIAVIWDAIAFHTTLSVPRRKQPEIALLHLGSGIDVGAVPRSMLTAQAVEVILAEYPRLGFKKAFLEAMGAVVRRKPMTGAVNLTGEVGRRQERLPIPDFIDICTHAEFDDWPSDVPGESMGASSAVTK